MSNTPLDSEYAGMDSAKHFKPRTLMAWAFFILLGCLFKLMHWPFASILLLTGSAGVFAYSFSAALSKQERNPLNILFTVLSSIWFVILVSGLILNGGNPYNLKGFGIYMVVFLIAFLVYYRKMRVKTD